MGKMNASYGSELHLLRWMGRHREEFDKRVFLTTGLRVAKWFDFGFSRGESSYDSEIRGLSFLPKEVRIPLEKSLPDRWRSVLSWDAVGISTEGTYILLEAKAHAGELKTRTTAERASARLISERLGKTAVALGGNGAAWSGAYYQAANRLFVQHLLADSVKSIQLNVFFCGDRRRNVICPKNEREWQPYLDCELRALGLSIDNKFLREHVRNMFLPVS